MIIENLTLISEGATMMCFLILGLFFFIKGEDRLRKILGITLLFWFSQYVKDLIFMINMPHSAETMCLMTLIDMTAIPTCAFLLLELIRPGSLTLRVVIYNLVPYLTSCFVYFVYPNQIIFDIIIIYSIIYSVSIALYFCSKIPSYHKELKCNYSYTEHLNLKWMWYIVALFCLFFGLWLYSVLLNSGVADLCYFILSALLWISISYFIFKHQIALDIIEENQNENNLKYVMVEPAFDSVSNHFHFIEELKYIFVNDKVYLNPHLTLNDVAMMLKTNRTYLSDYLNNELNTNFFDFVNEYRLAYSLTILRDSTYTIESVAEQSGFNSISTFRRAFNKFYKCTPNEYRKIK